MTLTEFLLARIAADESLARSAQGAASIYDEGTVRWHWLRTTDGTGSMWEPTLHDPARVLAECEAKRKVVGYCRIAIGTLGVKRSRSEQYLLRTLASVYAEHPDYRPEWKP